MSRILGIDLGTSNTSVAVVINGTPTIIPGSLNSMITPSYLYVTDKGSVRVGLQAKAEAVADPYNTIWATKRLIGRVFNDPAVQKCIGRLPYKIVASQKGEVLVKARNQVLTPVMVASLILRSVTNYASSYLKQDCMRAVITVPASFNDPQRKTTKLAGVQIGIDVVRLLNEPTAAALAWGYHDESEKIIAIYDLGGGTFDVSILLIAHGVFEVLATRGDSWLGGEDFDNRLVEHIAKGFKKYHGVDIYTDKMTHQKIKNVAENAKIELSSKESVKICIPPPGPDMETILTRPQFESMIEDLVDRTIETFKKTLEDAEMDMDELHSVVLVGGMTRLPLIRQKIEVLIGRKPDFSVNPDEAIAIGAAIHASALAGEKIILSSPAPVPQKPEKLDKVQMVETMSDAMPDAPVMVGEVCHEELMESLLDAHSGVGYEWEMGNESDEPPQPAGQAAVLDAFDVNLPADKVSEAIPMDEPSVVPAKPRIAKAPLLIDVLSQSVGISDLAGLFVPLIENNSKLPAKVSQVVTTSIDQQNAIRISVYQGGKRYAKDQVMLGEFVLQGIEAAPRGVPQVKVTFKIDPNGLFTVSAKDLKTDIEKKISIEDINI